MMRTAPSTWLVTATLLLAACASDPTASMEYAELEQQLAAAESALIDAEQRLAQQSDELETQGEEAPTAEDLRTIQQAWSEAWSGGEGEVVLGMMAPGGRHYCPGSGTQGLSGNELSAFVEHGYALTDAEVVSAVCTDVPGDPAIVKRDCLVTTEGTVNGHPGYTTVLHLRGQEGSLRVVDHHAYP